MNFKKFARWLTLLSILFLASCAQNKAELSMGEVISFIKNASNQTATLENGRYTYAITKEAPSERQEELTEGVFQEEGGSYSWYAKWVAESPFTMRRTLTERIQQDESQYSRMGFVNQAGEFIGEDDILLSTTPAWQKMKEGGNDLPPHWNLLSEVQLDEADIASMEVKEVEGATICTFTYKQAYLSAQEERALAEVEGQLEKAKKEAADPSQIQPLEKTVAYQKRLDLISSVLSFTVNQSGILIGYNLENSYEYRINDQSFGVSQKDTMKLLEYNLPNLTLEMPDGVM